MLIVTSQPFAGFGKLNVFAPGRNQVTNTSVSTDDGSSDVVYTDDGSSDVVYTDDGSSTPTMPVWVKPAAVVGVLAIAGYFILRH